MTRTVFIVLSLFLLWMVQSARAQESPSDEVFIAQVEPTVVSAQRIGRGEAVKLIHDHMWSERSRAAFSAYQRRGGGSFALVAQLGAQNVATIDQAGQANIAVLHQQGDGNESVLEQTGTGNIFGSYLTGHDNTTHVLQRGQRNVYILDFEGDVLQHTAMQIGTRNQAVQVGSGVAPFDIEQRGNNMRMIIRHNQ